MKRPLRPDEVRLWSTVLETVEPAPGRIRPKPPEPPTPPAGAAKAAGGAAAQPAIAAPPQAPARRRLPALINGIEPNRARRIAIGREVIARRLDLHGYGQDAARSVLERFITQAWHEGARAVLIITGKGAAGEGILRRRTPEWLAEPGLRPMIAGVEEARHRHGGKGALYVALKRGPAD